MSTTAAIITASICAISIAKREVIRHVTNVEDRVMGADSGNRQEKYYDMNSGNRKGRTRSYY